MTKRGRPFEPGNTFGRGRPRGSRNKSMLLVQQLLDQYMDPLLRKSVMMALQGNVSMLKTLLQPLLAGYRSSATKLGKLPTSTVEELSKASDMLIRQAGAGKISPQDARQFSELIEDRRRVLHTEELERRLRALEKPQQ